jgi:hypothetical protein
LIFEKGEPPSADPANRPPRPRVDSPLHADFTIREAQMRFGPLLIVALLLLFVWAGSFLMFHVASGLIHLLLLFAVISFIAHLFTGSRTA